MKKFVTGIALFLLCGICWGQQPAVIIPSFDLVDGATPRERDTITRYFMSDLANTKVFRVADRGNLEKRMAEMKFQTSDWSNSEKTAELMKGINADYVIIGTIVKRSDGLAVDAMLEELSTFEVIGTARVRMSSAEDAFDVMEGFVSNLVKNVTGSGPSGAVRPSSINRNTPVPANMVQVPAGTFSMGGNGDGDGKPIHQVTISRPFFMSRTEITQKEWVEVMGSNPSNWKGENLPVEMVSWFDALEYCNKRSQKEGLTPAYSGSGDYIRCNFNANGYRLPTEAEWEWAAKGGGKDFMITDYSGSNNPDGVAWYTNNSGGRTHEAGTKAPNSLGLYDMSGNVWEWCWDWYGTYSSGAQTDPAGASSGSSRVVRGGGSWASAAQGLRSAYRNGNTPSNRYGSIGFRVVRP
ncbi:hypothetical protein AGMMS49546_35850 [Spirochaetia bacterium]|nr:hypothetical protein AGMMS49546_35850 [Spirochaetia bacterium]